MILVFDRCRISEIGASSSVRVSAGEAAEPGLDEMVLSLPEVGKYDDEWDASGEMEFTELCRDIFSLAVWAWPLMYPDQPIPELPEVINLEEDDNER